MRLEEQKLWDRLRNNVKRHNERITQAQVHASGIHLERIENLVGFGTPDVDCMAAGGHRYPIELKARRELPARGTTQVFGKDGLNVDQKNWHLNAGKFGINSYILSSCEGYHWLHDAQRYGDRFNEFCHHELDITSTIREFGPKFWPLLIKFLLKH